jgi:ADP-ribosyl-[dinitrogen reductase] hydrolase
MRDQTETEPGTIARVLLGTAVGDSLGLPAEGLSRRTIGRRWPGRWGHRLVFGRGMLSDDTEHTALVAECLRRSGASIEDFERGLSLRLRGWLACLPPGVGLATGRAIIKLWLGFPPRRSGVFSAGNGPAMRSAIIGAYFARQPSSLVSFVKASTRITHTDPRAEIAALAVAMTAALAVQTPKDRRLEIADLVRTWRAAGTENAEWIACVGRIESAARNHMSVGQLAVEMGLDRGISGYALHTVPIALYSFHLNEGDFEKSLADVFSCGGDTDTTGAICGALAALRSDIPADWIDGIADWPLSAASLRRLAHSLEADQGTGSVICWPALPVKNVLLWCIVLAHAVRRIVSG